MQQNIIIQFFSKVCCTAAMEKVILTNSGSLWRWMEKTGYCSTILLSSAETTISYFEPVNFKVELMVHCSITCNCLYGSNSFVCPSGDDAVYCLCFGLPPQCEERSCRDCYILIGMIWPYCFCLPSTPQRMPLSTYQFKIRDISKECCLWTKWVSMQAKLNPSQRVLAILNSGLKWTPQIHW